MSARPHAPEPAALDDQIRQVLASAPAFASLDAERRRRVARDLNQVLSLLSEPAPGDPGASAWARPDAPRAEALAGGLHTPADALSERHADVSGKAAGAAGTALGQQIQAVKFPDFVASLIKGVFQAIVTSSIEQMAAFTQFLEAVTKSTEHFEESISDKDATGYLNQQFPGAGFSMMGGMMGGMMGMGGGMPDIGGGLGGQPALQVNDPTRLKLDGWGVSSSQLNTPGGMRALMEEARFRMARQKQRMLATLVMMGLNRIVVTDGKINAKVKIKVHSQEIAQQQLQERAQGAITRDMTRTSTHEERRQRGLWGSGGETRNIWTETQTVPVAIGMETAQQGVTSSQQLETDAKLTGAVEINFKSDFLPLEKLAAPSQMSMVETAADPSHKGKVGPTSSDASKAASEKPKEES